MYTLYYSPGTCSMAVHVVLNEIGAPFTLERVNLSEKRSEAFLKVNPRGQVPALSDDGFNLREGAAILQYLIDKHKSPLLPQGVQERAKANEWLMFANASLHPAYGRIFFLNKQLGDKAAESPLMKPLVDSVNALWAEVDKQLATTDYICGKDCTAADILLTVIANWSARLPGIVLGANVKRLLKAVIARPSYQKALTTEEVEYKVAA